MSEQQSFETIKEVFTRHDDVLGEYFNSELGAYVIPVYQYKKHPGLKTAVHTLLDEDYIFVGEDVYAWTLSIMKRLLGEESAVDWEICYRVGLSKYVKAR